MAESGSAQGFCLLKGRFFLATVTDGVLSVEFCPGTFSLFFGMCKVSSDNIVMDWYFK